MFDKRIIRGSFVLIIAFGLFNLLGFFYQFAMARMLSVSDYGILSVLFAIIYIFNIFADSLQTVITKYTVESKNSGQLRNLLRRSVKKGVRLASVVLAVYLLISLFLKDVLGIPYFLLAMNGLVLYLMFLFPVSRGILQGRKNFFSLGSNLVLESGLRLIISIGLVFAGFKVYGAVGGILVSGFIVFFISFLPLRDIYKQKEQHFEIKGLSAYTKPTIFITAIVALFYSVDVIIAKIIFSPETAGFYAIASILGKIIFWISIPIGRAMFPISAESVQNGNKKNTIFKTSIAILTAIIICTLIIFYFLSDLIISIFAGELIVQSSEILIYLGLAFSAVSIANMIFLYQLSVGKIKGYKILIIANIVEIILLFVASSSLISFSISFAVASVILLIISLIFSRVNRHI